MVMGSKINGRNKNHEAIQIMVVIVCSSKILKYCVQDQAKVVFKDLDNRSVGYQQIKLYIYISLLI